MGGFIKLDYDVRALDETFADMDKALKSATANSLNTVGRSSNKAIAKNIKIEYNIPSRSLKIGKLISLIRADARRGKGTFSILIRKQGRGLFKFDARQDEKGVSVRVRQARKTVKGAFISSWKRGDSNQRVFRRIKGSKITRTSKTGRVYKSFKREALFGPSVASLYRSRRSSAILEKTINSEFQAELDKQFNQQFEKG